MSKTLIVDLLGWAMILLWVGLSIYFYWVHDPSLFQSVGVVGIAAAVGYFALQRHAIPHPYGAIEAEAWNSKQLALNTDIGLRALAHSTLLAKAMVRDAEEAGRMPSSEVSALANVSHEHISAIIEATPDRNTPQIEEIATARLASNQLIIRSRGRAEALQAIVVIIGTLQSGLGSFLVASPT